MTDLSIIIVNFNKRKLLEECLDSIYKATHKITFEIIVADNGSTDGSQSMVKTKHPNINIIENKENFGFTKASNQGLKIYKGRYAMLLNNDTIVKDHAFDLMVDFMDKNMQAGGCGPKLLNIDGTIQHQGSILGKKFWKSVKPIVVDFVVGACLMARRETIDRVGLLDENLYFYNDDLDWCLRIKKAGYKIYYLPDAEVIHYGGYSSRGTFNRQLFTGGFKGGLYFTKKHYGLAAFYLYKIILFLLIVIYLPFFILSYPLKREKFLDRLLAYLEILKITVIP